MGVVSHPVANKNLKGSAPAFYERRLEMSKRFTDSAIWQKEFYTQYTMKQKLLLRYLFDNCNNAGIIEPNYPLFSFFIGEKVTEEDVMSLNTDKERIQKLPNGKLFLTKFIKFQQGNFLNYSNKAHLQIINILKENKVDLSSIFGVSKGDTSPIEPPSNPLKSPLEPPCKDDGSSPSNSIGNSHSLGNSLGNLKLTDYTDLNFKKEKEKKEKVSQSVSDETVIDLTAPYQAITSLRNSKTVKPTVKITDDFTIDFENDEYFQPYRHAGPELRQALNSWLIKNKLNQYITKDFIARQITHFAKNLGKMNELLGE